MPRPDFHSDPETVTDDVARDWFARHTAGLDSDEAVELAAWLAADSEHRAAWARAEARWVALGALEPDLAPELAAARRARAAPRWIAPVLVAGLLIALWPTLDAGLFGIEHDYATGLGERREFTLDDGSHLALNTDSRVRVRHSWLVRALALERGELFLDVAADRRRLEVHAAGAVIRDIGTRFTVRATPAHFEVAVEDGAVEVTRGRQHTRLDAGQALLVRSDQVWRHVVAPEAGWRSGVLIFDDIPLAEALTEFMRHHHVRFEIASTRLAHARVSGRFRIDAPAASLALLGDTLGFRVERHGEAWRLVDTP